MKIREYQERDILEIIKLFYETVHTINVKDYTIEQVNAWASGKTDSNKWNRSFLENYTLVAEDDGVIVGFADMDKDGYLDRLFVHKVHQGRGIATALCDRLEEQRAGSRFTTHASITAKPFFESRGYQVIKEQTILRNGVTLNNYVMEKHSPTIKG